MDEREKIEALDRVIRRLADKKWVYSVFVRPGRMGINYTPLGRERMGTLRQILIEELSVNPTEVEWKMLIALLGQYSNEPSSTSESHEPPR